jgi:hypothetical protein
VRLSPALSTSGLQMNEEWEFRNKGPHLRVIPDDYSDDDTATGYRTSIVYEDRPIDVTWYPDRRGVEIKAPTGVDEMVGREAAILGTVLIKMMMSGENLFREV